MLFAALLAVFALGAVTAPAFAQETCKTKAVGKDGKPLAEAALNSFMAKCIKDACEPKAIDKNGKPLAERPRTALRRNAKAQHERS